MLSAVSPCRKSLSRSRTEVLHFLAFQLLYRYLTSKMLAFFPSSTSAHAQWPYVCVSIGKGAEGFLKAGNQPSRPTPFYSTHRAGTGPTLQHLAKTSNCNYLRKCLSFEVQLFSQRGVGEKNKTEGLRLHHTSLMLILSRMLEHLRESECVSERGRDPCWTAILSSL